MEEVKKKTTKKTTNSTKRTKEKNDINEKELKSNLEEEIVNVMIFYYANAKVDNKEIKKFVNYLRHYTKENKSNNNFTNRVFGI